MAVLSPGWKSSKYFNENDVVCSDHFFSDDYEEGDMDRQDMSPDRVRAVRLRHGVVPSRNLAPTQRRGRNARCSPMGRYICKVGKAAAATVRDLDRNESPVVEVPFFTLPCHARR